MDHGGAAPTGCYKCGRPGHWSRDCPSNPNTAASNDLNPNNNNSKSTQFAFKSGGGDGPSSGKLKSGEKPKKVPKTRPKLSAESLLSNDGLGYVLRHFPKAFKFRGRGHEVQDLGNLLGLYAEWHSHLLPYYPFDQFVHKVEQVGSSKRVKVCLRDLRDRVSHGGDPTKLHEDPYQPESHETPNQGEEAINIEEPSLFPNSSLQNQGADDVQDVDDFQDAMLHDLYENTTEDPSQASQDNIVSAAASAQKEPPSQEAGNIGSNPAEDQISDELKARIEANRLKALEKAAARAKSSQAL
ncbi:TIMELESS-interacting protein [Heracleum sosnowskyi]|uniref:TIMELESS-interacting protein n=1 Tax=Heracleum sosnowskyi TaxID=360622 RepID=A0AAD8ISR6_9APIA|nr:TIMELESS-interacting protein [Heracleum sosnowskyi]